MNISLAISFFDVLSFLSRYSSTVRTNFTAPSSNDPKAIVPKWYLEYHLVKHIVFMVKHVVFVIIFRDTAADISEFIPSSTQQGVPTE